MSTLKILRNAIRTPDGTVLESTHRHDYRTHLDANGETYMVDGGTNYLRRSKNKEPAEDISEYMSDDHEHNRKWFMWTSFGKEGKGPVRRRPVKDLSTDHINAILDTQTHLSGAVRGIFESELVFRRDNS